MIQLYLVSSVTLISVNLGLDANASQKELDRVIYDEIRGILGRGDLLLKEMISYYCYRLDVYNYLKWKDSIGIRMVEVLENGGGLRFPI